MVCTNTNPKLMTMFTPLMLALAVTVPTSTSLCFAGDLPGSEEIIAKMIDAGGGAAAMRKIKNRVMKMTMDFGMGGMTGKGVVHYARPGNQHTVIEIQGMGTIEEGVTDGVAWALAVMTGPQIKEGGERGIALLEADLDGLLNWKSHFKKIECVSKETLDGKEYFKVELTPHEGSMITTYVDTTTYLTYRSDLKLSTAMGEFDMIIYSEDYRPVDGVQYSHKSRVEIMGQKRVVTIESIEHNVEMPKDIFKLPDEIKALVAKSKEQENKEEKTKEEKGKQREDEKKVKSSLEGSKNED
ncbi:MAG: hypothetical protein O7D91_09845 [Planctomycetota bacterium]|nr:hypothetical protein [Planctomycetota bacterium]